MSCRRVNTLQLFAIIILSQNLVKRDQENEKIMDINVLATKDWFKHYKQ